MEVPSELLDRDLQGRGRLRVGEPLDVDEVHGQTPGGGKRAESSLQRVLRATLEEGAGPGPDPSVAFEPVVLRHTGVDGPHDPHEADPVHRPPGASAASLLDDGGGHGFGAPPLGAQSLDDPGEEGDQLRDVISRRPPCRMAVGEGRAHSRTHGASFALPVALKVKGIHG